jgi:hypothetical protein
MSRTPISSIFLSPNFISLGFAYSLEKKFSVPNPENGWLFIKNESGYIIGKRFSISTR